MNNHQISVAKNAEFLAVVAAQSGDDPKVILTFRLQEGSFDATNLSISPDQAHRLVDDIQSLFQKSQFLSACPRKEDPSKEAFVRIMRDETISEPMEQNNEKT